MIKIWMLSAIVILLSGCQIAAPLFVNYNGVRRDVATWINNHQFLSMQQKRSLVQLSKAQQKLKRFPEYDSNLQFEVTKENQIALICARQQVSEKKIKQLQDLVFVDNTAQILLNYEQLAPKIKLDTHQIQCE